MHFLSSSLVISMVSRLEVIMVLFILLSSGKDLLCGELLTLTVSDFIS